tara:strand:- start:10336 stop:11424 length:1089 start_codon:yes stop_codon:yes gene_type:complete
MDLPLILHKKHSLATVGNQQMVNFTSNDYLGFSDNEELKAHVKHALDLYGLGATGSRRLSGNHQVYLETEAHIARWIGKPAGVMFNSGYQMNGAIFSTLASKSSLIITDKLIHASIIDGVQNSEAQLVRFRHNDVHHLSQVLKKYAHNKTDIYIVIESIYSMDGDMSPLLAIIELKKQYQATLIVDEAHSIGLYGNGGNGWVNQHSGLDDVDVMLLAFGKSFGLSGAMLVSNQEIVQRMKAKCRSYIYSTALPLPIASGIKKASEIISERNDLNQKLNKNIRLFKTLISTTSNTQIQPIIIGDKDTAIQVERKLLERGFFCRSVHHPTVPKGESRLRITITSAHTATQIKALAEAINNAFVQ